MPKPKPFAKEVDLCATFIAALPKHWVAYPETAGFDILLVRADDGFQIGIEAKLRMCAEVMSQAIEERGAWCADLSGPDCRAVLIPELTGGAFDRIAKYLGVTIIRVDAQSWPGQRRFTPRLPDLGDEYSEEKWHEWSPTKRCNLPSYVPDVKAGAQAPLRLTEWKIGALKLQIIMERNGHVTREDFKTCKVDHRRWLARETGWLRRENGRLVKGDRFPDFAKQHPIVYEQIKADMAAVDKQGALL